MMESLHESEPPLFLLPLHLRPQRLLLLPLRLLLSELQLLSLFLRRSHMLLALLLDLSHRLLRDTQMAARKDLEMINVQQLLYGRGRGRRRLSLNSHLFPRQDEGVLDLPGATVPQARSAKVRNGIVRCVPITLHRYATGRLGGSWCGFTPN